MKYTEEILAAAAAQSASVAGVLRVLGVAQSGGMHAHISRRMKALGVDTTHFTGMGHRFGVSSPRRKRAAEILVVRPFGAGRAKPYMLRRALIDAGVSYRCARCRLDPLWCGQVLVLHVDHINGNYLDCTQQNLRFLCPNCHTQTASWAGKNKTRRSYTSMPQAPVASVSLLDASP